jgi:hypothetical protein
VSRYVVERGSDFGVGFRQVVLSGGEVVYKCVRCPCVFSSLHDVGLHVAVCGERREKNVFMYGYIGKCTRFGEHGVRLVNTLFNVLRCRDCRSFKKR